MTEQPYYLSFATCISVGQDERALAVWGEVPHGTLIYPNTTFENKYFKMTWTGTEWKVRRKWRAYLPNSPFLRKIAKDK